MKSFKLGPRGLARLSRQGLACLSIAALAGLSACGGGTSQIQPFAPTRIITFGDETSLVTSEGKKYGINGLNATTAALDCSVNPIWVQTLANSFGLVFKECNPNQFATPNGLMYASVGAKVADFKNKLDAHFAISTFGPKDMVTVMVGANDILELYADYPTQSHDALMDEVRVRARNLAAQVNRIANANGRVVLATVLDQGLTPFAIKERNSKGDIDRAAFLTELTHEFNLEMRVNILNDGRLIGLVLADENLQTAVKYPSSFGFSNVTDAACLTTVTIDNCTTNTLMSSSSPTTWLWASDNLLSPGGQSRLATLALSRARNNPF
ncbi:SGNH/GDSL hydrolase family protein [Roseateles koreensis]|uniref:SGNH/GDSL hydrolase family protein n=1 Tax=Roseateles koreensis TaxID=2987526 RepID=A0ABT5KNV7_9BURK|nr:SGNH/GDSL hydrolase family protein [Roseateles koreensis]MDC8784608.1 SGNH/GDSL hydrolase family protein [Roseateles koreensis]